MAVASSDGDDRLLRRCARRVLPRVVAADDVCSARIYAVGYLRPYFDRGRNGGPHFALLNLTSLSFVLDLRRAERARVPARLGDRRGRRVAAGHLGLPNQKIRFAGFNYLVSTHVGLFVLVAAFMLLHSQTGSMDFARFGEFLATHRARRRATIFLAARRLVRAEVGVLSVSHLAAARALGGARARLGADVGRDPQGRAVRVPALHAARGTPEEWMGWAVLVFGALSAVFGVLYTLDAARPEAPARLLVDRERRHRRDGLRRRLPRAGPGTSRRCAALGFAGGLLHILNHAFFKCSAVLRRRRGLSRDAHRRSRATRRARAADAADGGVLPARRPRDVPRCRRSTASSASSSSTRGCSPARRAVGRGRRRARLRRGVLAFVGAVERAVDDARVRRRVPRARRATPAHPASARMRRARWPVPMAVHAVAMPRPRRCPRPSALRSRAEPRLS